MTFALFDDAGKFLAGRVMSEADASLQVELDSGKRVKVKAANVLLKFTQPAPAALLAEARTLADEIDLDLAWEFAPEGEFGFADLARDYFDAKAGTVQQVAALLRLFDAPHYFRRAGKGQFKKAPEETVKAALLGIERKKQIAAQIEQWAAELAQGLNALADYLSHAQEDMQQHIEQTTLDLQESMETIEIKNIELDMAHRRALEASRIKSEFLANMSHELRTPLTAIRGHVSAILEGVVDDPETQALSLGVVEAEAVVLHQLMNGLERGERAVAFVQVKRARRDAERTQRFHTADAEHQLLTNARAVVAAVQPRGQLAIFRAIAFDVAVEQVQLHAADVHAPHLGVQRTATGIDSHADRPARIVDGRVHRQVLDFRVEILFDLVTVVIETLLEVALVVEQADGDERNAEVAAAFYMVAGKHA